MRYDVEVNIVGQLTQDGLKVLANMFYDTKSADNLVTPLHWDSGILNRNIEINSGGISTDKFNYFRNVHDTAYTSGIGTENDLSLFKLLIRENIICPLFNGGDIKFYRYGYRWSANNVTKMTKWDEYFDAYWEYVDDDIEAESASAFTLRLASPGYLGVARDYKFVDFNTIDVQFVDRLFLPSVYKQNTIFVVVDSSFGTVKGEVFEVNKDDSKVVKTLDITHVQDDLVGIFPVRGSRYVVASIAKKTVWYWNGYRWYNLAVERAFGTSSYDYKFTVFNDPLHDDKKICMLSERHIEYKGFKLGGAPGMQRSLAGLPEFPASGLAITDFSETDDLLNFRLLNSAVLLTNKTTTDREVFASYTVHPIISYKQRSKESRDDVVYRNINLTPSALSFKSGLVCVYNTFSPTVSTKDGGYIPIPIQLSLNVSKSELSALEGVKVTAKLSGIDNIPIKGAKIKFRLTQDAHPKVATFMASNTDEFESYTGIDGSTDALVLQTYGKYGYYIQKDWVNGGVIDIPFDIGVMNPYRVYLYIITADDPVLGKLRARALIHEQPISDYYNRHGRLDSYEINGRKMAYVKMNSGYKGQARILKSSFIKPVSIQNVANNDAPTGPNNKVWIRDLYIKDFKSEGKTIMNDNDGLQFGSTVSDTLTQSITGWDPNWQIVQGERTLKQITPKVITRITYQDPIPGKTGEMQDDRIVGYWLITGSGGIVDVDAVFENEVISLAADKVTLNVVNYVKSEQEFIIGETDILDENAVLGSFGYYSIAEYLKNPFNMTANTYCCVNSDPINHQCIHKGTTEVVDQTTGLTTTKKIASYYKLDSINATSCVHTPEWEASNPQEPKCPGLDAHYVNPYILHVQKAGVPSGPLCHSNGPGW